MRSAFVVLSLLLLSVPTHANTWLCIAEKVAYVSDNATDVTDAKAGLSRDKFLVSEDGVSELGKDQPFLTKCSFQDGGQPVFCEAAKGYGGHFRMDNNVFTLVLMWALRKGGTSDYVYKGKCSLLDTD